MIGPIPRDIRIFLLATCVVALAAVLVTAVIMLTLRPASAAGSPVRAAADPPIGAGSRLEVSDLALPDERETELGLGRADYRVPRTTWSSEEIRTYWSDPRELSLEILEKENRAKVLSILEGGSR